MRLRCGATLTAGQRQEVSGIDRVDREEMQTTSRRHIARSATMHVKTCGWTKQEQQQQDETVATFIKFIKRY